MLTFEGTGTCSCHQGTSLPPSAPSGCMGTALSKCHRHKTDHQKRDGLTSLCHAASALLAWKSFRSSRTPVTLVLQESLVGQTLKTAQEHLTKHPFELWPPPSHIPACLPLRETKKLHKHELSVIQLPKVISDQKQSKKPILESTSLFEGKKKINQ